MEKENLKELKLSCDDVYALRLALCKYLDYCEENIVNSEGYSCLVEYYSKYHKICVDLLKNISL